MSPAARLDADSILGAVFDILDREGVAALSMRTLAARLDVKAASLYYHVPNKAALLQMVADRVATQIVATITPGRAWRELLDGIAHNLRGTLRAHPGAAAVVAVQNASPHVFEEAVPLVLLSMRSGLHLTDDVALHLVQSLYVLVTGLALAEFGNAPEPPAAPAAYYDAWFDIAVSTFLDGVQARYGTGDPD
ncbi:TetR/AcrR family transcriptional regulator [Microtetraspora malaysiensis]|uniref:TetR/AcrR family transcriptional regulator n=1 Tax=Microtetraspora malaysiensis TaxID=161358 RepID=UPI003D9343F0